MYSELFIIALEISELVNERKKLHHYVWKGPKYA